MAFSASNMTRTLVGGRSQWTYRSNDAIVTVAGSGYFDSLAAEIQKGDVILVIDEATPTVDLLVVSSTSGATPVTTVNGT